MDIREKLSKTFLLFLTYWICQDPRTALAEQSPNLALVDQIFQQPLQGNDGGICFERNLTDLPESMIVLKNRIEEKGSTSSGEICSYFANLTKKPADIKKEIDFQSIYYRQVQEFENSNIFEGQEKPSTFSGASSENIRLVKDRKLRAFFEGLFHQIADHSKSWNPTTLSRSDLFHGHMTYSQVKSDLLIVFHSKEFPKGEPSMQDGFPRQRFLDYFGETLNRDHDLNYPTSQVTRRNFVWSLKQNRICGVDTTLGAFTKLAEVESFHLTLDQDKLTELGESGEISNINYFPKENVHLFFDFHKGLLNSTL